MYEQVVLSTSLRERLAHEHRAGNPHEQARAFVTLSWA